MKTDHKALKRLGWSAWFEKRASIEPDESLARVVAVDRDQLLLINQNETFRAKLSGNFRYHHNQSQELPCVGDWVQVVKHSEDVWGMVHSVLERRSALRRKAAGENVDYQMIAANVDEVIIVMSCHFDFNVKRLERYLVMVRDGGADPCVLLTKTDLVEPEVVTSQMAEIRSVAPTVPILTLSNVTQDGLEQFKQVLQPARTYCFVGSSGVGKSTLINSLLEHELQQTKDVSATGEGRHTTVRRELIVLDTGALVVDNPGMREFGIVGAETGIQGSFADIVALEAQCRFRNCAHGTELGCAVQGALDSGELSQEHYDNYLKLKDESAFNEMSYVEKRHKDRDFGKYIKSVKKSLKKR